MLDIGNLHHVHKHHTYLSLLLGTQEIFLVGGCIRDILLGRTIDPKDIDMTMSGNPDAIRENMNFDETTTSRFRTEKFGTMTFIPKNTDIEYELTPFRTEGGYTDKRHPDKITWSNDLIADSKRRDFTINALYYSTTILDTSLEDVQIIEPKDTVDISACLANGASFLDLASATLVLTEQEQITKIFANGVLQKEALKKLLSLIQTVGSIPTKGTGAEKMQLSLLIDPHGGLKDMIQGKIQTVGDPDKRFQEDALRIIRGLRFVNILNQEELQGKNFDFTKPTRRSMQENAELITHISGERLHEEIVKVFKQHNPFGYISLLHELRLLPHLFPALAETVENQQPVRYHSFDTYTHTVLCLHALQTIFKNKEESQKQNHTDYLVKLAMLYHDVGKPEQYEKMSAAIAANPENPDRSSYEYHTESGAKLATRDFKALSFSKKECEQIARYIRRHHRPGEILDGKETKRATRLRKLMSEGGYEATMNLLDITIADRTGQFNPLQSPATQEIEHLKILLTQIYKEEGRFTKSDMNISGKDIMEAHSIPAGPKIGELLEKCFNRVMSDVKGRNTLEQLLRYVQSLDIS